MQTAAATKKPRGRKPKEVTPPPAAAAAVVIDEVAWAQSAVKDADNFVFMPKNADVPPQTERPAWLSAQHGEHTVLPTKQPPPPDIVPDPALSKDGATGSRASRVKAAVLTTTTAATKIRMEEDPPAPAAVPRTKVKAAVVEEEEGTFAEERTFAEEVDDEDMMNIQAGIPLGDEFECDVNGQY